MNGKELGRTAEELWLDAMAEATDLRRRRHKRYGSNGVVSIRRMLSGPELTGDLFDISAGGCLVWMAERYVSDPSEVIQVRLQADSLVLRVMGSVRYACEEARLLGVGFRRLSQKDALNLEQFIGLLQAGADAETRLLSL